MIEVGTKVKYHFTNEAGEFVTKDAAVEKIKDEAAGSVDLLVDMGEGVDAMRVENAHPLQQGAAPSERTYSLDEVAGDGVAENGEATNDTAASGDAS